MSSRLLAAGLCAAAVTTALAVAASCGAARRRPADLVVTSYAPSDADVDGARIEIQFDRPAVDSTAVGRPVDPGWLAISPAFPWTGRWTDRQTLTVDPGSALAPATRYRVALRGPLADRTGGFAFDFVHQPLAVDGLVGVDTEALPLDAALPVAFSQPVRARDAAAGCRLTTETHRTIALAAQLPEAIAATVALVPVTRLSAGTAYTFACRDVVPAVGNAPLGEPYELAVTARPQLAVVTIAPSTRDVPADEVTIEVELSTEVELEAIRAAVTASPPIPGLDGGWLDGSGRRYRVTVDLAEHTSYRIAVTRLVDAYGQVLATPYADDFTTGEARARISMEAGIFALEASATGYPVWSRNLGAFAVDCAAVPRDQLVELVTGQMNYDAWGGNDDSTPIDWKALSTTRHHTDVRVDGARDEWHLAELDLGASCGGRAGARGVYLADVSSTEIAVDPDRPWLTPNRRRVLANVTDLGVLLKVGPASGIVWVTSLATGAPVAGAKVTIYTPTGERVAAATTDREGLVRIPGSAIAKAQPSVDDSAPASAGAEAAEAAEGEDEDGEDWDSYRSQRLVAIVEAADDLAVVDGNWANGIQIWNFGLPEERRGSATRIRGFIQSDRGLYRPGDAVHFKGLVRELAENRPPRVPRAGRVDVEVTDSLGAVVYAQTADLSRFGGFHFDLALGEDATVGDYYVTATLGTQAFRERFAVEEYRPAAFELAVDKTDAARPGGRLAFTATARYLFGAPVAGGTVEWSLRRRPHPVRVAGFDEYAFTEADAAWWERDDAADDYGDFVADGSGETDGDGRFRIETRDPDRPNDGAPVDYLVATNVTDSSGQTLGKTIVVTAHHQGLYLGVHAQESVQAVGMPFGVNVVAVDPDGARIAATAHLSFIRAESRCTWGAGRSDPRCVDQHAVALERDIAIPATGTATERIYPTDPGEYLVRVETTDATGARVTTGQPIWVLGAGEAFWSGDESARMTLVASRRSYHPGEVARLAPQANLDHPTALVTIERDGVLAAFTRRLSSPADGIDVPVQDAWTPNVYASVVLVAGRHGPGDRGRPRMKMGVVELAVATDHKTLDVAIELDHDTVEPGQPVHGRLRVTAGGAPVSAELAVAVADEGVLQLVDYQTPDPQATFYAPFGLGVDTGTNWNRVAKLATPGAGDPDEGGDFAAGSGGIRSRFVASAFWAPALVTDARGEATFDFVAPDNLTAFRVMATAADAADRFGAGERRLTVAKPLIVRPAMPRFLAVGDRAVLAAVVHNETDRAGTATVTATATGVTLDHGEATVDVPAHGSATASFVGRTADEASATIELAVAMNGLRDAARVVVPVARPRVDGTRTVARQELVADTPTAIELAIPADVLRDESELIVTIDRTGLGDLEPGLRYLVDYPYGCLEQTVARLVAVAAARDLAASLGRPELAPTATGAMFSAGVAKIARHQQGDGQFSLWPQSPPYPHLTALAVWGLTELAAAGVDVPAATIDRGVAALAGWAGDHDQAAPADGGTLAMTAYLLATHGRVDHGLVDRLYDQRAGLPTWGQAFLLRALVAGRAAPAQLEAVRGLLVADLIPDGDALVAADDGDDWTMGSPTRSAAMALAALVEAAPTDRAIPGLVRGLDRHRRADGRWASTEDNLWSLIALAAYARRAPGGAAAVTVAGAGATLATRRITGSEIAVVRAPLSAVGDRLTLRSTAAAHVTVRVHEVRRADAAAAADGLQITRSYLDDAGQPLQAIKVGDPITVRIEITSPAPRRWVAIVDPLPAGLEVDNPHLAATADTARADLPGPGSWLATNHQELHDDRVEWFVDELGADTFEIWYRARAATAGTFTAAPAHAEAMYEPDVAARTLATTVTIAP